MSGCYAVESPTYQPAMRLVDAITQAAQAAVTTSFDHDFKDGLVVTFFIPKTHGMQQMHKQTGVVTVTSSTTFTVDIDSRHFDAFSVPGSPKQCAQVIPIGGINSTLDSAVENVLPY